jgi:hypothetical protein
MPGCRRKKKLLKDISLKHGGKNEPAKKAFHFERVFPF